MSTVQPGNFPSSADDLWILPFLFKLSWEDVQTSTAYETDIKRAADGSEHRRSLYSAPRTSLS